MATAVRRSQSASLQDGRTDGSTRKYQGNWELNPAPEPRPEMTAERTAFDEYGRHPNLAQKPGGQS